MTYTISNTCTVIMYHYVEGSQRNDGPKGIDGNTFNKQIAHVKNNYSVISPQEYAEYINGERETIPENACVLTFDDGLKEHYEIVLPILKKYNLRALFFISGMPYESEDLLTIHKVHLLRTQCSDEQFIDAFKSTLYGCDKNVFAEFNTLQMSADVLNLHRYDAKEMQKVKYFMTYCMSDDLLTKVINTLCESVKINIADMHKTYYCSPRELKEMVHEGMSIGNHTHHHKVLSRLAYEEQVSEVAQTHRVLEEVVGVKPSAFSVPYGKMRTFNADTYRIFESLGYSIGYITERGINVGRRDRYSIFRIDTNELIQKT